MKIGMVPESFLDRIALWNNLAPMPLIESFMTILLARSIMAATSLGVIAVLQKGGATAEETAQKCRTDRSATKKLLDVLVGCNYARRDGDKYRLTKTARKWFGSDSGTDLTDNILFRYREWELLSSYEEFIRTGKYLDVHNLFTDDDDWQSYQKGMRSLAGLSAQEVGSRTPLPKGATAMLDIGGSHGYHSVVLCRKHAGLKATVLDLPIAIKHARPILEKEQMGERVVYQEGDVLETDLGESRYDLVFTSSLVHHFDDKTNRELTARVARSLKPGGFYVIMELIRPGSPEEGGQFGMLLDLYFAMTSKAGTWSYEEMADWQSSAGLKPQKPIPFRSVPGAGQQWAIKE